MNKSEVKHDHLAKIYLIFSFLGDVVSIYKNSGGKYMIYREVTNSLLTARKDMIFIPWR